MPSTQPDVGLPHPPSIQICQPHSSSHTLLIHTILSSLCNQRAPSNHPSDLTLAMPYHYLLHCLHVSKLSPYSLVHSLTIPALLCTCSFITQLICDTPNKPVKHFISRIFTFILSLHFTYPMPLLCIMQLEQLRLDIDTYLHLFLIFYCSAPFSMLPTLFVPVSFYVPHLFHILHSLQLLTLST